MSEYYSNIMKVKKLFASDQVLRLGGNNPDKLSSQFSIFFSLKVSTDTFVVIIV